MLTLLACVGSGVKANDPYRLQKISNLELCAAFGSVEDSLPGNFSRDQLESELHRRDLFSKDEWILVRRGRIGKGMSVCGLIASWGPGRLFYMDGGAKDKVVKYTYPSCRVCSQIEVETMGGKVQSWYFPGNKETYPKKKRMIRGKVAR